MKLVHSIEVFVVKNSDIVGQNMAKQVAEVEIHATTSSDKDLEDLDISVHQVDDRLFLGNLACARDYKTLQELQITHLMTLDLVPLPRSVLDHTDLTFKFIKLADVPKEDLISRLPEALEFIKSAIALQKNILVHCYFGVSRSAAVVIAYMMEKHGMNYEDTLALVKQKRRFVCPNAGFVAQLKLFAQMGYKIDKDDPRYKQFRLKMAGQKLKQVKILPQSFSDLVKADPGVARERPEPSVYRCRRCRRVLATQHNLIPHVPKQVKVQWAKKGMRPPHNLLSQDGEGLIERLRTLACQILDKQDTAGSSSDQTPQHGVNHQDAEDWTEQALEGYTEDVMVDECIRGEGGGGGGAGAGAVCRLMWFVEPLSWMQGVTSQAGGKLLCPKCRAKVGTFSWVMGQYMGQNTFLCLKTCPFELTLNFTVKHYKSVK
ncbi:unnamed protein product [Diatraea saccharalis]|uniref:Protein-tyrosine-phosphatase n=1 Tax=Diatraea saccharalis TaxID=40085 RepID=A0A9P0C5Y8_9NEOP|nr:unnamed protein product [Diatraea saccharalis]